MRMVHQKMKKTLVINLFAGPGTGKSTHMAGIFSELKFRGINCEMAPEYAKEKTWEGSLKVLENQIYIFGKQMHAIQRLMGKVDVIITDSPILLSLIYAKNESQKFENLVTDVFQRYDSLNYNLIREKAYNPLGRNQTEEQAKDIDIRIKDLLVRFNVSYKDMPSCRKTVIDIANEAEEWINRSFQD